MLRTSQQGADTALWLVATRPPTGEGIWLDRHRDTEHALGFTRDGAGYKALAARLAEPAARALAHDRLVSFAAATMSRCLGPECPAVSR